MLDRQQLNDVTGATAYDRAGEKLGKVGNVYLDDETGDPAWVTVHTGLFGMSESFVPVRDATLTDDGLTVPYDKDTVKDAPNIGADVHLSPQEETELYQYYGLSGQADDARVPTQSQSDGYDTSGPDTDDAMTRSEERLEVGTRAEESGRVRLRKYVVTENVTQTVPVRKEKAVLETEPVTDANVEAATSGPEISEEEHEVVLHEERPVVQKTTEPVERVRLSTEQVADEDTVSEDVRKEQIEVDGDVTDRR